MRHKGFLDAEQTITEAAQQQQSVADYVETLWQIPGHSQSVIQALHEKIHFHHPPRCLEIGPGTGRYLEKTVHFFSPAEYTIYETDEGWRKYLQDKYQQKIHAVTEISGTDLGQTPDNSHDLCLAHGVFVYLDTMVTFSYLAEMARCLTPGGYLFFDIIDMDRPDILKLVNQESKGEPGWFIPISARIVISFLGQRGCRFIKCFQYPYGTTTSDYLLLQKDNG